MTEQPERVVHASLPDGGEVVRYYDGEWWIEYPKGRMIPGYRIAVKNAAIRAARTGEPILGLPHGRVFDRFVREELALMSQEEADRG